MSQKLVASSFKDFAGLLQGHPGLRTDIEKGISFCEVSSVDASDLPDVSADFSSHLSQSPSSATNEALAGSVPSTPKSPR